MAGVISGELKTLTVTLDSNLESKERYFVTLDTTDDKVVNIAADGSVNSFALIEGGDGSTTSVTGAIALSGRTTMVAGATVTSGSFLMPDANGKCIAATDGNYYGALAITSGVAGDIVEVNLERGYLETT